MKKLGAGVIPIAFATAILAAGADRNPNAERLLKAAINMELVDGNVKAAIDQYKRIVDQYGRSDRATAAQALLRLAGAYQKLGDAQAKVIYERLVREYADQNDAVAVARERLAVGAGAKNAGIITRQVWSGPQVDLTGSISPDGRYLSFVDWETGDLAVRELSSGTNRRLTAKGTWRDSNDYAEESAISPDSKQVAYAWFTTKDLRYSLRVAALIPAGTAEPRILVDREDVEWIGPYAWSPDGKWIAIQLKRRDRTGQIGLVNAADGTLRVLKSVDWRGSTRLFFSPDGNYLAFDLPAGESTGQHDVFVMAADGSRELPVAVHPANDLAAGWAPDGQHVLFQSDRGGSVGLWGRRFANGRPEDTPQLLKSDIGYGHVVGTTRTGALFFGMKVSGPQLHIASVDFDSGRAISPAAPVLDRFVFDDRQPVWSPDGTELAFNSIHGWPLAGAGGTGVTVLTIRSMQTGQTRELRPNLVRFNFARWSPDGRSFVAQGTDLKGREGLYRIDARSSDVSAIVQATAAGESLAYPEWAPDGRSIFFQRRSFGDQMNVIVQRDLASGTEREIMRVRSLSGLVPRVAPDGESVAVVVSDDARKETALLRVSVATGERRELVRLREPERIRGGPVAWTPDGHYLLFGKGLPTGVQFWCVPAVGGEPRRLDVKLADSGEPSQPSIHPDGRRIVFMMSRPASSELWTMENFVPRSSAR